MSEELYKTCQSIGNFAAQVRDALGGIIKTRSKSSDGSFWTAASEMPKAKAHQEAHQECEKMIQGTAELKQKLYPQLGQIPQESVNTNVGLNK